MSLQSPLGYAGSHSVGFAETQLTKWSNPGAETTAANTYASVRNALENPWAALASKDKEVYLQGSYRSKTNIRGDSDVDIVIQLNKTFHRDISAMSQEDQQAYLNTYGLAEYNEAQFKADVEQALRAQFGSSVQRTQKVFLIDSGNGRLTADVLPALQFRRYNWFVTPGIEDFVEGVRFVDTAGNVVINYPKLHIENGQAKNSAERTNGWYKPSVRMFKNVRNYLVEKGKIADGLAPSYFLECLIYNAPDSCFGTSFSSTLREVVQHLWTKRFDSFICQNAQVYLFGNTSVQWNSDDATKLLTALMEYVA